MTQEATVPVAIKIMPGHAMICCDITCDTTAATNVGWEKSWGTTVTLATKDKLVSETLTSAGEERIAMLCMALSDTTAQKKKKSNLKVQMTSPIMSQGILQPQTRIVLLKVLIEVTTPMQISRSKHSADDNISFNLNTNLSNFK